MTSDLYFWLDAWQTLPEKFGKLSKQTYTRYRQACIALPQVTSHLLKLVANISVVLLSKDRSIRTPFRAIPYDAGF